MVSVYSISFLLILFYLFNVSLAADPINNAESSCEEEAFSPPTTKSSDPTPPPNDCETDSEGYAKQFKRKNGFWCSSLVNIEPKIPLSHYLGNWYCQETKQVMSSMETEEEINYFTNRELNFKKKVNITGFWVGAAYNKSINQYFWNDGHAVQKMSSQTTVIDAKGEMAWIYNLDSKVPGNGNFQVVNERGDGIPNVETVLCGYPVKAK